MELPLTVKAVDLALATIAPYGRPDLEARLRQTRDRLLDDRVRVLVVGEFKQGKSLLVNALLGAPVCPVDDDVATAVPTVVRYAEEPAATLVRRVGGTGGDGRAGAPSARRRPLPSCRRGRRLRRRGRATRGNRQRLQLRRGRRCPRKLLAGGLVLVDTPGVGGLGSAHARPRWPRCRRPTPCCSSPTPRRSTPRRSWSSCARRCGCARTSPAC